MCRQLVQLALTPVSCQGLGFCLPYSTRMRTHIIWSSRVRTDLVLLHEKRRSFLLLVLNNCSAPQTVIVSANHQFCCTTIPFFDRTTSNWWLLSTNQVSLAALSQCRIVAHTVIGDVQSCICSMHQQNSGSPRHTECADTPVFQTHYSSVQSMSKWHKVHTNVMVTHGHG